jgi:polysaccharide biosynthesis/export protein
MNPKLFLLLILTACLFQTAFGQTETVNTESLKSYQIGPGDIITIKVLGEPDFNIEAARVDEDGKIQVPFSDTGVLAKCRTEKELRADLVQHMSKLLRNPQVTVYVKERHSRPPAVVSGEVKLPAPIVLTRPTRLLEIINFSNGLTKEASGMIEVFHTQPPICADPAEEAFWKNEMETSKEVPSKIYSYSSLRLGKEEANPIIYPGDLIVARKAPPVYVIGEVMALKEITITENGLSLVEAIAQAGGFNREAKKKEITIQRLKPGSRERESITVNYQLIKDDKQKDVMLQPEDIVVVDKTKKSIAQTILEMATGSARNITQVLPQRILY